MGGIYILIILLCRVAQHLFNKRSSIGIRNMSVFTKYSAFRQITSSLMGLALIIVTGSGFDFDSITLMTSLLSGIMLVVGMGCSMFAMKSGTIAMNSMFSTAGLIIPCIAGIVLFDTPMSVMQWVGIAVFFVSAYLLTADAKNECSNFSLKTLALMICGMISNGLVMLAQQMFTHYNPEGNVSMFSFLSFGIVGIFMIILSFFTSKNSEEKSPLSKKLIAYGLILSTAVFIINQLATTATAFVPPAVLFSFINGGSTIIAAVIAFLAFGERLTVRKTLGIIIGVASLIIIKAF